MVRVRGGRGRTSPAGVIGKQVSTPPRDSGGGTRRGGGRTNEEGGLSDPGDEGGGVGGGQTGAEGRGGPQVGP